MGALMSSLWSLWFPRKEYKIVLVGLDNAGKTTVLYQLHLGQTVVTTPTIGANVELFNYKNMAFQVWDLGGQAGLRQVWNIYYANADAIIVVIDSADRARMGIIKAELFGMLEHPDLARSSILVFANKQDLPDAMGVSELSEALTLHAVKTHDWHVVACCALTGAGLLDGLAWISQRMNLKQKEASLGSAFSAPAALPNPTTSAPSS